jgi:hypothetical protein
MRFVEAGRVIGLQFCVCSHASASHTRRGPSVKSDVTLLSEPEDNNNWKALPNEASSRLKS